MASASRTFSRAFARASAQPIRASARTSRPTLAQSFQQSSRRGYASGAGASSSSKGLWFGAAAVAAAGAGGYFYLSDDYNILKGSSGETQGIFKPTKEDYQKVYNAIAERLVEEDDYDDGSYGPVLVRLAWHASGTYDAATGTGGSNGATMRFAPEGDHGANAGLTHARDFLEPVKGASSEIPDHI